MLHLPHDAIPTWPLKNSLLGVTCGADLRPHKGNALPQYSSTFHPSIVGDSSALFAIRSYSRMRSARCSLCWGPRSAGPCLDRVNSCPMPACLSIAYPDEKAISAVMRKEPPMLSPNIPSWIMALGGQGAA